MATALPSEQRDPPMADGLTASASIDRPALAERIARPFQRFLDLEISSALVLLAMTVLALVWANSPFGESYDHLLHEKVGIAFGDHSFNLSINHWIKAMLMAIFFFLVDM